MGDFHQFCSIFQKMHFSRKFIIFELLSFNQVVYSILNTFKFNYYRSCRKCILWGGEGGTKSSAKSSPYEKYPLVTLKLPKQVKRFGAHCLILLLLHWNSTVAVMLLPCSSKAAALQLSNCNIVKSYHFLFSTENMKKSVKYWLLWHFFDFGYCSSIDAAVQQPCCCRAAALLLGLLQCSNSNIRQGAPNLLTCFGSFSFTRGYFS